MNIQTNYYAVQTEEDKEFSVKSKLKHLLPNLNFLIPLSEETLTIGGKRFEHQSLLMPEYVILEAEELTDSDIDKISKTKGVIGILSDKIKGKNVPSKIEPNEIKRFIKKVYSPEEEFKNAHILYGQFAGYLGTVEQIIDDEVHLTVNIKNQPKIVLPIWYLGKEEIGE